MIAPPPPTSPSALSLLDALPIPLIAPLVQFIRLLTVSVPEPFNVPVSPKFRTQTPTFVASTHVVRWFYGSSTFCFAIGLSRCLPLKSTNRRASTSQRRSDTPPRH